MRTCSTNCGVNTGASSRIEGIGRPWVEPSFLSTVIDRMECVPDAASVAAAHHVSQVLGRRVGPSTGTNVWGADGLLDAVRRICYELPVVGMDVVEVSPPYDHADITVLLGNRVVLEALSAIARRRKDARDGTTWDPRQPLLADRIPGE